MYVQILLNEKNVGAMVDTGATHNFISQNEVGHYGIKLGEANHSLKAVNLDAKPILGMGEATLKVGPWEGKIHVMVVPLDDFQVILGMDFFMKVKAAVVPHLHGLMIYDERSPSFVQASMKKRVDSNGVGLLSALQIKFGLKKKQPTFLATL